MVVFWLRNSAVGESPKKEKDVIKLFSAAVVPTGLIEALPATLTGRDWVGDLAFPDIAGDGVAVRNKNIRFCRRARTTSLPVSEGGREPNRSNAESRHSVATGGGASYHRQIQRVAAWLR